MHRLTLLITVALLSLAPAHAAVRFADWAPESMPGLLAEAGATERKVLLVITQPDWCPGCIELDRQLLRNPDATRVAELTRDWLVLEVYGYDEPGATMLAEHGVAFLGTPTTLLLQPGPEDRALGSARQLGAIVGFPGDFLARLEAAAQGHDAIAEAQARVREDNDAPALHQLAQAFLAAGNAEAARRVFQSLMLREELAADERRAVALQAIVQPTQRVEKDHRRALAELDAWLEAHPEGRNLPDYVSARTWSLLVLGEREAAMELIRAVYLDSDDPDDVAQYLFLAFRSPTDDLLADAEARARAAIDRFPAQAARFHAAHGRLLRRLGRYDAAEAAFTRAVEIAGESHPSYGTYLGQLEFVRHERAARTP